MQMQLDQLLNDYNFDITCEKVETRIGTLDIKTVEDYSTFQKKCSILLAERSTIMKTLYGIDKRVGDLFKKQHIYEFLRGLNENNTQAFGLDLIVRLFRDAFIFLFNDDVLFNIKSCDEYDEIIALVKHTHGISIEVESPNPIIARLDRVKKELASKNSANIDFDTMYSTVWIATGTKPNSMTIYQFSELFFRQSKLLDYNTSTLFKTAFTDQVKIEDWFKNRLEDTKKYVDLEKLTNSTF